MHEIQNDERTVNVLEKVMLIKSDTHSEVSSEYYLTSLCFKIYCIVH